MKLGKYKVPDGLIDDIKNMTLNDISKKYNININTLRGIIYQNKIPVRELQKERSKRNKIELADKFAKDFSELQSLQKVADKHGVTRQYILFAFKNAGYVSRKEYVKGIENDGENDNEWMP